MDKIKYVNRAQRFFEDKIDWKFYNYLTDITTPYEDKGYFVVIDIATYDYELNTKHIYFMSDDKQYKYLDNIFNVHVLEKYYNKELYGLYYGIGISKDGARMDSEKTEELLKRIKSKCHKVKNWDIDYLTIIKTNGQNRRIL